MWARCEFRSRLVNRTCSEKVLGWKVKTRLSRASDDMLVACPFCASGTFGVDVHWPCSSSRSSRPAVCRITPFKAPLMGDSIPLEAQASEARLARALQAGRQQLPLRQPVAPVQSTAEVPWLRAGNLNKMPSIARPLTTAQRSPPPRSVTLQSTDASSAYLA
jgi:hypothetical protein